jgi:hypothetical protein
MYKLTNVVIYLYDLSFYIPYNLHIIVFELIVTTLLGKNTKIVLSRFFTHGNQLNSSKK